MEADLGQNLAAQVAPQAHRVAAPPRFEESLGEAVLQSGFAILWWAGLNGYGRRVIIGGLCGLLKIVRWPRAVA